MVLSDPLKNSTIPIKTNDYLFDSFLTTLIR